ncbi:hypothetical protein AB0N17_45150 [Streptomyces sp. NPDC051133]|uniref:hypothetical protein n=1 Tax=Streptomyces sp. NPDC051133 TaxID=3155521 RepID=UPI00341F5976
MSDDHRFGDEADVAKAESAPPPAAPQIHEAPVHDQRPVPTVWGGNQVDRWDPVGNNTNVPARRSRRAPARPFMPDSSRVRKDERLRELMAEAPRYAALLNSYTAAQSGKEALANRNIQLYGLTAQGVANEITVDKALMRTMGLPTPRLIAAHYVDAVLDRVLHNLNPEGTDLDAMEAEKDYVWGLAQRALAYREYISEDPEIESLPKQRSQCPLRVSVNQRFSRMIDLLNAMPDATAQPFEMVSVCVAEYLDGLEVERPAFTAFWRKNLVTSYQ